MFVSLTLFSQVEKPITQGDFLIGGSAYGGYYSTKTESNTDKNIRAGLSPSLGYFVVDGLAVGLSISTSVYSGLADNDYSSLSLGAGPFAKFYTSSGIFISGSVYYSSGNSKSASTKSTSNSLSIHPELGYAYFINSKIALEASLNYSYQFYIRSYENQPKSTTKYNQMYFSIGFQKFW